MTRTGKRLIQDFIIPALDCDRYGELMRWVDLNEKVFRIKWSHKNAARWSSEDTSVFQDWDRLKGHYKPDKEGYYMQSKQRFRAALQKLKSHVTRLNSPEKGFKYYQLLDAAPKVKKEKNQVKKVIKAIPTSVIRQNLSYDPSVASTSRDSTSRDSTSSCSFYGSSASEDEDDEQLPTEEEARIMEQKYKVAQDSHFRSIRKEWSSNEVSYSDQKENIQMEQNKSEYDRIMKEPVTSVVYQNQGITQVKSPLFFVVKNTCYRDAKLMGYNNIGCALPEPTTALNLSTKLQMTESEENH